MQNTYVFTKSPSEKYVQIGQQTFSVQLTQRNISYSNDANMNFHFTSNVQQVYSIIATVKNNKGNLIGREYVQFRNNGTQDISFMVRNKDASVLSVSFEAYEKFKKRPVGLIQNIEFTCSRANEHIESKPVQKRSNNSNIPQAKPKKESQNRIMERRCRVIEIDELLR